MAELITRSNLHGIVLMVIIPLVIPFDLKARGPDFEQCVFNFQTKYHLIDYSAIDLGERILTLNQGYHLWTTFDDFLGTPTSLLERCSVNILIRPDISGCFLKHNDNYDNYLMRSFYSRLHGESNVVIVVLGPDSECNETSPMLGGFGFLNVIVVDVHLFFLSEDYTSVQKVKRYCSTCFGEHQSVTVPQRSLIQMKRASSRGKSRENFAIGFGPVKGQPYLPCTHLYKQMCFLDPSDVGCDPNNLFLQIATLKLNITVVTTRRHYTLHGGIAMPSTYTPKHLAVSAVIEILDAFRDYYNYVSTSNMLDEMLVATNERKFMYCTKSEERQGFSFLFWITPMDQMTWLFLGTVSLVLVVLLRGEWFPVFTILMRQDCRILEKKRLLIIFIFVTIVFTYGYEGVISSFVTIPTPYFVYERLQDLVREGYQITELSRLSITSWEWDFTALCMRENISVFWESSNFYRVTEFDWEHPDEAIKQALTHANTTHLTPSSSVEALAFALYDRNQGLRCEVVQKSVIPTPVIYIFTGYYHAELSDFALRMQESGILSMFRHYSYFVLNLPFQRRLVKVQEKNEGREVAFSLTDWKILSPFLVWSGLILLTQLIGVLEIAFYNRIRIYQICIRFLIC